tara:strand:- start:88 stop:600 length:513 start_codon:yes stop_codon:yes gene_type:complete
MSAGKVLFVTALDSVKKAGDPQPSKDVLGDVRMEGNNVYKYVQYDGGAAPIDGQAGDCVAYLLNVSTSTTEYDTHTVTADFTNGQVAAGVLQADMADQTDATKVQWGWIKIKGLQVLRQTPEDSPADGDGASLGSASGDGKMKKMDAATDVKCGVFVDASTKEVLLDCPF